MWSVLMARAISSYIMAMLPPDIQNVVIRSL